METVNIRDYATDKHKTVDDTLYGGGFGMLIKPDVLAKALDKKLKADEKIYYLSPKGKLFDQVINYATTPYFSEELFKAREEYKNSVGEIYEDDQSYENRMSHFLEWYVFDRNITGKTITPLF